MTGSPPPAADVMVRSEQVCKYFGALEVLKGISLNVNRGEVMCLVGPSGSGKSTFLRCINHLEQISAGRLWVDGELVGYTERGGRLHEMPAKHAAVQRRDIGMVFQKFNLFPHLTALENITEAPTRVKGVKKVEAIARANQLLEQVGMPDKAKAYPAQLSGGQQQRVAIARALANSPKLLIADEPTGQLDADTGAAVMELLRSVVRAEGMTAIISTHDPSIQAQADSAITLADGRLS